MDSRLRIVAGLCITLAVFAHYVASQTPAPAACAAEGHCVNSFFLTFHYTNDSNECLNYCKEYDASDKACNFWSINFADDRCSLFNTCNDQIAGCEDCIYGEATCDDFMCEERGTCQGGKLLNIVNDISLLSECLTLCNNGTYSPDCEFVSHSVDREFCMLFDECPTVNDVQDTRSFISAEKVCRV